MIWFVIIFSPRHTSFAPVLWSGAAEPSQPGYDPAVSHRGLWQILAGSVTWICTSHSKSVGRIAFSWPPRAQIQPLLWKAVSHKVEKIGRVLKWSVWAYNEIIKCRGEMRGSTSGGGRTRPTLQVGWMKRRHPQSSVNCLLTGMHSTGTAHCSLIHWYILLNGFPLWSVVILNHVYSESTLLVLLQFTSKVCTFARELANKALIP